MTIRKAQTSDIKLLSHLFRETIRSINTVDYSNDEIEDWVSCGDNTEHWINLITNLFFIVAERKSGEIVGFSSIRKDGYLHSMFVHKEYQRQGIASLLYAEIHKYAKINDIKEISSGVSITARGFFEKKGFVVKKEQKRKANNQYLTNYQMVKLL